MSKDFWSEEYWKLVEEFIEELKTSKYWFKNDNKPKPEWKLYETRSAALRAAPDAARDAAWGATRDATRDAAWSATRDAARDAAWSAAWSAARDAALSAAWSAARGAARDASLFASMLVCLDIPMPLKHLQHVNARMEVWRKGYGLLCDVNGTLYVYKKPQ